MTDISDVVLPSDSLSHSIIAVHGIAANPDKTWVINGANWLKDAEMLPSAVPASRIMRFGYASQWLGNEAIQQRLPLVAEQLVRNLISMRKVGFVYYYSRCTFEGTETNYVIYRTVNTGQ
jgi:hypothetical protein